MFLSQNKKNIDIFWLKKAPYQELCFSLTFLGFSIQDLMLLQIGECCAQESVGETFILSSILGYRNETILAILNLHVAHNASDQILARSKLQFWVETWSVV